ncbi:MAG TPA: carboxypeptidase regulatory-like domain-containing protein [Nannocystis exedens]|nr:carboxypeptidase regulatory-like domain-containing protein [Nannocystis exedens]
MQPSAMHRHALASPARADMSRAQTGQTTEGLGLHVVVVDEYGETIGNSEICVLSAGEPSRVLVCWQAPGGRLDRRDLPPVNYRLWAGAKHYGPNVFPPLSMPPLSGQSPPQNPLTLVLPASDAFVSGNVTDVSGGAIEGALLRLDASRAAPGFCQSRDEGRFYCATLEGRGSGHLEVVAEGYARGFLDLMLPASEVRIALFPESKIHGVVVDVGGTPVGDVEVALRPSIMDARYQVLTAQSDQDGHFVFPGLGPGVYRPFVQDGRYRSVDESLALEVGFADVHAEVEIIVAEGGRLTIDVMDEHHVCTGASASLVVHALGSSMQARSRGFARLEIASVPTGEHLLRCTCLNGGGTERRIEIRGDSRVTCDFNDRVLLRGRVVDEDGDGVAGASVNVIGQHRYASSDEQGAFSLALGQEEALSIQANSRAHRPSEVIRVDPVGSGGAADIELVLGRGECIHGRVQVSPQSQDSLSLFSATRGKIFLDSAQKFEVCGLAPGESIEVRALGPLGALPIALGFGEFSGSVRLIAEDSSSPLELRVDSRTFSLQGVVIGPVGEGIADAIVIATRVDEGVTRCFHPRSGVVSAATHAEGDFEIDRLSSGRWMVSAAAMDGAFGCVFVSVEDDTEITINAESPS